MVAKNRDLHGFVPEKSTIALILVDVINTMEFPEAKQLYTHALPMAKNISALKKKAKELKIPIIYVNDNFGRWRSDFKTLVTYCSREKCLSKEITNMLKPDEDDYFVLKAKYSAFFNTSLELLLKYLEVENLVITGMAGDMCVLFTVSDAYMRDFNIYVPSDCIASNEKKDNKNVLALFEKIMKVNTTNSKKLNLKKILKESKNKPDKKNL